MKIYLKACDLDKDPKKSHRLRTAGSSELWCMEVARRKREDNHHGSRSVRFNQLNICVQFRLSDNQEIPLSFSFVSDYLDRFR